MTGAVLVLALGIVVLFLLDPFEAQFFPRCPIFAVTGLKCPGCGTARALHAVLHGRFAEALRFNMALPAFFLLVAYCIAFPRRTQSPAFVWAVLTLVVVWGIARNLLGV